MSWEISSCRVEPCPIESLIGYQTLQDRTPSLSWRTAEQLALLCQDLVSPVSQPYSGKEGLRLTLWRVLCYHQNSPITALPLSLPFLPAFPHLIRDRDYLPSYLGTIDTVSHVTLQPCTCYRAAVWFSPSLTMIPLQGVYHSHTATLSYSNIQPELALPIESEIMDGF